MKNTNKKFRVVSSTYFHYQNGIVARKNRIRILVSYSCVLAIVSGGFFIGKEYAWPMLKNNSGVQRIQRLNGDNVVDSQAETNAEQAKPIKQEDELLRTVIQDKIAAFPKNQQWSVFVYDLNTERTANVNVNQAYSAASLYKLFLLESLEQKLPYNKWQKTRIGGQSISECVNKMLQTSDDPCAQGLGDYIGWENVDKVSAKSGFKNTKLAGADGRETTTADVGELFARLKRGQMLSDFARRSVFDSLYQQADDKGIANGCKDCRTANKTGELTGVVHDGGIVTHGSHSYVLVIMSKGGSHDQISEITKLVEMKLLPGA